MVLCKLAENHTTGRWIIYPVIAYKIEIETNIMTKESNINNHSCTPTPSYKDVIVFAVLALFSYGAWTKLRVDNCLDNAREAYNQQWASKCELIAKNYKENYANCINSKAHTTQWCKSAWNPKRDSSAECALPADDAKYIQSTLENEKNFCIRYG